MYNLLEYKVKSA